MDGLTDRPTDQPTNLLTRLLMLLCNLITAKHTGWRFVLFGIALFQDVFHQLHQLQHLCHDSTKLIFVLLCASFLSPLLHKWWFAVRALWLWYKTWESAVVAGVFFTLFFALNVTHQSAQRSGSEMKHSDTPWLIMMRSLMIDHSLFSGMTGLIVGRDTFYAVFHL